jgi:raffinose/stachyose/melibiose transport system permease protein
MGVTMTSTKTVPAVAGQRGLPRTQRPRHRRRSVGRSLWWFALPALAVYAFVVVVPTFQGGYMSLTNWSSYSVERHFVGFSNFGKILRGDAGSAAERTLYIAAVTVAIENVLGLLFAILLNGRIFGKNLLRTIIFAPLLVSPLVVGYLFQYIFGPPDSGAMNALLKSLDFGQVDFLGNPTFAFWIIVLVVVWQSTGLTMVIYLAGLQSVPSELLETAALDGAGPWARFWHITRPLLAPAFTINLMLGLIGGLKLFDQIFATTGGGPAGQTQTVSTLIYQLFSQFGFYGQSAALAVLLAAGVAVLSLAQFAVLRRQEKKSS